jgi:putative ATP-dependent endonuclease of the OLD family
MITRVIISGYRCFKHLDFVPHAMTNLVVGANEAGKSTLLEAIALGLTGRINGRWASEELNPFWFHRPSALAYFAQLGAPQAALPEISIELYLSPHVDVLQQLRGVHNSQKLDAPGVALRVAPSPDYRHELAAYLAGGPPALVPVEYYAAEWRDFADQPLVRRPKELATSIIDSRTIRSTSGVDYHTREMLSEHLDEKERAEISLAHRASRQQLTQTTLKAVNTRLAKDNAALHSSPIGLQMDPSARSGWEGGVVPQVDEIPFAMAGQGQQAMIKVAAALGERDVGDVVERSGRGCCGIGGLGGGDEHPATGSERAARRDRLDRAGVGDARARRGLRSGGQEGLLAGPADRERGHLRLVGEQVGGRPVAPQAGVLPDRGLRRRTADGRGALRRGGGRGDRRA